MKYGYILVSRKKGTKAGFKKAGGYVFKKKSGFGNIRKIRRDNPYSEIKFRKVKVKKYTFER